MRRTLTVFVPVVALVSLFAAAVTPIQAEAEDDGPVAVKEILSDPDAFHLRMVSVQGTVRHIRLLEPYYLPSGSACYGSYLFYLEDESGILEMAVMGICGRPALRTPEVSEGDVIRIEAEIQKAGRFGYSRDLQGNPIEQEPTAPVQGIVKSVIKLGH